MADAKAVATTGPQTFVDGQFSITTDDDPESVRQALGLVPPVSVSGDEGDTDDDDESEADAEGAEPGGDTAPAPAKPNGAATDEPEEGAAADEKVETKAAPDAARNKDGTFKKKSHQFRIDQAISRQRDAERARDAAEARARDLELKLNAPREPEKKEPERKEGFPHYAEYLGTHPEATLEQWLDARDEYRDSRRAAQEQERAAADRDRVVGARWQQKLQAARAADPEFDSKIDLTVPVSAPMMEIIRTSEIGPQLMTYFSAHPDEARWLAHQHPTTVLWAMGRLHERLSAASTGPAPAVTKPSQATPPIKPVGGSSVSPAAVDYGADSVNFDDHFRHYNAADRKAGRLR